MNRCPGIVGRSGRCPACNSLISDHQPLCFQAHEPLTTYMGVSFLWGPPKKTKQKHNKQLNGGLPFGFPFTTNKETPAPNKARAMPWVCVATGALGCTRIHLHWLGLSEINGLEPFEQAEARGAVARSCARAGGCARFRRPSQEGYQRENPQSGLQAPQGCTKVCPEA